MTKRENKDKIIFQFDDPKDCEEVLAALTKKTDITWHEQTKRAMMHVFKNERLVIISKSIYEAPKPLRF